VLISNKLEGCSTVTKRRYECAETTALNVDCGGNIAWSRVSVFPKVNKAKLPLVLFRLFLPIFRHRRVGVRGVVSSCSMVRGTRAAINNFGAFLIQLTFCANYVLRTGSSDGRHQDHTDERRKFLAITNNAHQLNLLMVKEHLFMIDRYRDGINISKRFSRQAYLEN